MGFDGGSGLRLQVGTAALFDVSFVPGLAFAGQVSGVANTDAAIA
jgi:hypothetical protein